MYHNDNLHLERDVDQLDEERVRGNGVGAGASERRGASTRAPASGCRVMMITGVGEHWSDGRRFQQGTVLVDGSRKTPKLMVTWTGPSIVFVKGRHLYALKGALFWCNVCRCRRITECDGPIKRR